jgi:hypothetical protein
MVALAATPASRSEIAAAIGHKSISSSIRQAVADLMAAGLMEYTVPEKPNSRLQKYRLTPKAVAGSKAKPAKNPTLRVPAKRDTNKTNKPSPAPVPRRKGFTKGAKGSRST